MNNKLHVILQSLDNPKRVAYFKFGFELGVDPGYKGPLSANERIAYEIGEIMDLPLMPVQFYRHLGLRGHLRWAVPKTSRNWSFAETWVRHNIRRHFRDPGVLVRMFVFDVFTCNHDRHEGNVLFTVSSAGAKHDLYLIDHDLALYGTQRKWQRYPYDSVRWFDAARFLRLTEVGDLVSGYEDFEPAVETVKQIHDDRIDAMVDGVSALEDGSYLSSREADMVKAMLKMRRERLEPMLRKWCEKNGKT